MLESQLFDLQKTHNAQLPNDFDSNFKKLIHSSTIALSEIFTLVEIVEDLKDKIFRYENRFRIFFVRLLEVVLYAGTHYEEEVSINAVTNCIKNMFILISEYGETPKAVEDFFKSICAENYKNTGTGSATGSTKSTGTQTVRASPEGLLRRNAFQRSSSRAFKQLDAGEKLNLSYLTFRLCLQYLFEIQEEGILESVLSTFEITLQMSPILVQILSKAWFHVNLK